MACLDNIIKLSRTECECFDNGKPLTYNEGQSEIYLDELEGLSLEGLQGTENCEKGTIWDMMDRARTNATLMFKNDLLACLESNYSDKRKNYKGLIGDTTFNSTLNFSQQKAGLKLLPYEIVGGYLTLNRIGLVFNAVGSLTIDIYSNEDYDTPIASYNVTTAANTVQYVELATPLKLPLWSEKVSQLEYYVVYETNPSVMPKNVKENCGCTKKSLVYYKNWVSVQGIRGSSSTQYNMFSSSNAKEMNGLILDVEFTCKKDRLICSDEYPLDFNNGRVNQIAYAVRFKAAAMLVQMILDSPAINRYTLLGREALYGKRNHYNAQYEKWVSYLCENTEITNQDCLICKPNPNFVRGTILV